MTFPTKVDLWAKVLLIFCLLYAIVCLGFGIYYIFYNLVTALIFIGSALVMLILLITLVWPISYTLRESDLLVKFGWVKLKIAYTDISDVCTTKSWLAGPALSMDRLAITHKSLSTIISPSDKDKFLEELGKRVSIKSS